MSNSLDPDQARRFVGPDLGPNCLPRLSADDTGRQRVKHLEKKHWIGDRLSKETMEMVSKFSYLCPFWLSHLCSSCNAIISNNYDELHGCISLYIVHIVNKTIQKLSCLTWDLLCHKYKIGVVVQFMSAMSGLNTRSLGLNTLGTA